MPIISQSENQTNTNFATLSSPPLSHSDYLQDAINAIRTEQKALDLLIEQLDERFIMACQLI